MESVNKHLQSTASPVKFIAIIFVIFIFAFISGCADDSPTPQGPKPTNPVQTSMGTVNLDFGNHVITSVQSKDGGFILSGNMNPSAEGGDDITLTKLSSSYQIQWTKDFGSGINDQSNDAAELDDGSIVTTGYTQNGSAGNKCICVMRVSSAGSLLWAKSFFSADNRAGLKICKTQDGNILVAAEYACLLKIDLSGNIIWSRNLYGNLQIKKIQPLPGTGFVVLENSGIIKLSSDGHVLWYRYFMNGGYPVGCTDLYQTSSGDFLIAGSTTSIGVNTSMILKVSGEGEILWSHTYGPIDFCNLSSISSASDGGYIAGGNVNIYYNKCGFYFKFSEDGLVNWARKLDTTLLQYPKVFPVWDGGMVLMDNVYIYNNNAVSIIKCKADGETCDNSSSIETSVNNINLTNDIIQVQDSLFTLNSSALIFNASDIYTNYKENCKW